MQNQQNKEFTLIDKLFPSKKICIESELNNIAVEEKLKAITSPYSLNKRYFKGIVNPYGFILYSEYDYSSRYLLRPEIIGEIKSIGSRSKIYISFELPITTKSTFNFGLFFNLTVFLSLIIIGYFGFNNFEILKNAMDLPDGFKRSYLFIIPIAYAIILFIGFKSTVLGLEVKINNSINIFKKILNGL